MSQNKTFEDFLRWKKDQQTRGGGGGRRYRDDSSDTDSSVEEVKFSKRNVNKKKYYEESDTSSSSSDEYPSRRKKQTIKSERGGDKYRSSNNRGNSSDRERERGKSSRSGRNGGRERERERERERGKSSKSSRNERYRDSSDEEDEIRIVNKRGTLKGRSTKTSSSTRRNVVPKHKRPTDNRISSDSDSSDDQDRRYRRNVDSSDSEEIKIRKRKPITSKSRRSKSEHIQKKPINKKRVDSSDDESPRRNKSSKTPTVSKGRKIQHKKPVDTETSSDDEQQHRINHKKETSSSKKKPNIKQINNEHSHPKKEKFQIKKVEEDERDSSSSSSSDDNDEIEKPKKPTISTKNKTNNHHHTSEKKNTSDIHFEHNLWMEKWEKVFSSQDKDAKKKRSQLKELLQQIDHLTDRVCDGSNFIVSERSGQDVNDKSYNLSSFDIASAVKKTRLYSYHNVEKHLPKEGVKGPTKTTAHFIKSDIIDVGLFIKKEIRKNPLILMMGDPRTPGGEKHRCLFGEEIAIWRRTAIREYLEDDRRGKYFNKGEKDTFVYDIPQNGAVYCPDVPVFRSKQSKGYGFNAPETLSFVIVPPIMKPNLVNGRLTEEDIEIVRKKINMIFLVALENNHDAVVVTAFGCGYAQNPPKHIAEILTEAIAKFKHYFSNIAFAIVDNANARKNSPEGNIAPFSNVFSTVLKKHSPQENVN